MASQPISVLIGVPVTHADFVARVETSDFLSKFRPAPDDPDRDETLRQHWEMHYGPFIGRPLGELSSVAQAVGARCFERAILHDVEVASAASQVVVVLSHWKGSEVLFQDLLAGCSWDTVMERAQGRHSPLARWITDKMKPRRGIGAWWPARKRPSLVELLNEAVKLGWEGEDADDAVDARSAMPITLAERRRSELDDMLQGLIVPGNQIEWFDGLYSKYAFEAMLDPQFNGFLDLTTCTSTVLGEYISRTREGRLRMVMFPEEQEFIWHAQCVASAVELTTQHNLPYPEARVLASQLLRRAIRELSDRPTA
jgi:hypothetical protein